MKTLYKERLQNTSDVTIGEMKLTKDGGVILTFYGDKNEKVKLGKAFVADAIENYLTIIIRGAINAAKKGKLKNNNKS